MNSYNFFDSFREFFRILKHKINFPYKFYYFNILLPNYHLLTNTFLLTNKIIIILIYIKLCYLYN